ncbi:MAG TPA: thiamine phosphate synthase [Candidatus Binataceae bacterium]|nr:thiamine phosphate synthase [Candidatus Binataceae bacterium]
MTRLPSHFYAMVDPAGGHEPVELARMLLDAGARILQLRLKQAGGRDWLVAARSISRMCRERGALFIVNDRADIALLSEADGVHLGQTDLPLDAGRRVMGHQRVIGISTHTVEQALAAESGGADYIGFGAIYSGGLKQTARGRGLDELRAVRAAVKIPIVAIGGITEATVPEVLAAGANACAIISDVVKAPDLAAKVRAILALKTGSESLTGS